MSESFDPSPPPATPPFLYGTAWKEDRTEALVQLALSHGFRGIDTANQPKHYDEFAVGRAIVSAIDHGLVTRDGLFLQTKFTFRAGQDHRLPYEAEAPIAEQVEQSFASSLEHLGTNYIDSYLLHGPSTRWGLTDADWVAWGALEAIHDSGCARRIGVSNMSLEQLKLLCRSARVRPSFIQNRCYASQGWDREVREYCVANEIQYQGFSLLTANRNLLGHPYLAQLASKYGHTVPQTIFRFAVGIGILPLTGTSSPEHMRQDLAAIDLLLTADEVDRVEHLAGYPDGGTGRQNTKPRLTLPAAMVGCGNRSGNGFL